MGVRLLVLAVGVLAVLAAAWQFWAAVAPEPARAGPEPPLTWYCPNCRLEMTCPPGHETKETLCPRCAGEKQYLEVRRRGREESRAGSPVVLIAAVSLPAILALTLLVLGLGRKRRARTDPDGPSPYVRCPYCHHKVYLRHSGPAAKVFCSACRRKFLPARGADDALASWQEGLARWDGQMRKKRESRKRERPG
jgi:hypothetical protein